MRHLLLFTLSLFIGQSGFSQITLESWQQIPDPVDSSEFNTITNPSVNVSTKNGSDRTWDYSSLSGNKETFRYLNPSSSGVGSDYPKSNLMEYSESNDAENFYVSNSSEYSMEGSYIPGAVQIIYDDLREFIQFPMDFNDVVTDSFSGTVDNIATGQTFQREGTVESTYDGYGTLILPYDTVENVARVRNTGDYIDKDGGFEVASYKDTIITWYNTKTMTHIASRTISYRNGNQQQSQATYIAEPDLIAALGEGKEERELSIRIHPNPASERFTFELPEAAEVEEADIEILDMTGRSVKRIDGTDLQQNVDISGLESGVHFFRYEGKKGSVTKKLMVR